MKWAITWRQPSLGQAQWLVLATGNVSPDLLRLGAALHELKGDAQTAAVLAQSAMTAAPDDIETRVLLGRLLLREGGPRDRAIGKRLLLEQTHRVDQIGLKVLRLLSDSGELTTFEANQCLEALHDHPARKSLDTLTEAGLAAQLRPYRRDAILVEAGLVADVRKIEDDSFNRWHLLEQGDKLGQVLVSGVCF